MKLMVKELLGIKDDISDSKIDYYLKKISLDVLRYCTLEVLNEDLESFVIEKVSNILQIKLNINNGAIKAISRGDVKIDYKDTATSNDVLLTDKEKDYLNQFKPSTSSKGGFRLL